MLINFDYLYKKYKLQIRGVVHVGAHFGEECDTYLRYGIKHVALFEPLNSNFQVLKARFGNRPEFELVKCALGSSEQQNISMNVSSNQGASSSILKPKVHLTQHPDITFDKTEDVEMKTMDEWWNGRLGQTQFSRNNQPPAYNFLNIDVQGYELEVLKGAKRFLHHIDYIVTEVNRDELYENCPMVEQIDEFLSKYELNRVETSWDGGTWGDAFYVRA